MSGHGSVDVGAAVEHLRADPGLPIENPLPAMWQEPPHKHLASHQSPKLPEETDVLIIGSGVTGCSIARHLLEKDSQIRVTLLDARTITSGATGRNGGFILTSPDVLFAELHEDLGPKAAKEIVNFTLENQKALFNVCETLKPGLEEYCQLRKLECLNLFTSHTGLTKAKMFSDLLAKDFDNVEERCRLVSKEELLQTYGIANACGGATVKAGAVWPYRLITGVFEDLYERFSDRFFVEANTPAESVTWSKSFQRYAVVTNRGTVTSKHVVHATNAHTGHLLPLLRGFLYPLRCHVIVQDKHPSFKNEGADRMWYIHSGGMMTSVYQDPVSGTLLITGYVGASSFYEEVTPREDKNATEAVAHLSTAMDEVFGSTVQDRLKESWTGIMGWTTDGLPIVGQLSKDLSGRDGNGEWISAGYNGYGMVYAWLSGEHIADKILKRSEPRRVPPAFAPLRDRVDKVKIESVLNRVYNSYE